MGLTKEERKARADLLDGLMGIPEIAPAINEVFGLSGFDEIADKTPRLWWWRSYQNYGISHPMPQPELIVGKKRPRPFWRGRDILAWYADWKGVKLPKWVK